MEKKFFGIINIASGKKTNIKTIAKKIAIKMNKKIKNSTIMHQHTI